MPGRPRKGPSGISEYVLCYEPGFGECAVKFLSWAAKDKLLAIGSQNAALYPAVYRKPSEIRLVGRVIWASREFK
jgi:phage repressor protein C with HTH and peptisase S24 domain